MKITSLLHNYLLIIGFCSSFSLYAEKIKNFEKGFYLLNFKGPLGEFDFDSELITFKDSFNLISMKKGDVEFVMRGKVEEPNVWMLHGKGDRKLKLDGKMIGNNSASGNYISYHKGKKQEEGLWKLKQHKKTIKSSSSARKNDVVPGLGFYVSEVVFNDELYLEGMLENNGEELNEQLYLKVYCWDSKQIVIKKFTKEVFFIYHERTEIKKEQAKILEVFSIDPLTQFTFPLAKGMKIRFRLKLGTKKELENMDSYTYSLKKGR